MTDDLDRAPETESLRSRAEARVARPADYEGRDLSRLPVDEVRRLVHELDVRRIELEMQNDDLRRTQAELETARDRYTDLFDLSPLGYFVIDQRGRIRQVNAIGADMLGENAAGLADRMLHDFILRRDQDGFFRHLRRCFRHEGRHRCELEIERADRSRFHAHVESIAHRGDGTAASQCLTVLVDISPMRRSEQALRESEERLRMALGAASAGVWECDIRTGSIVCSPDNFVLCGVEPNPDARAWTELRSCVHPQDLAAAETAVRDALAGRVPEFRAEFRVVMPDGKIRWLLGLGRVERSADGAPLRMSGINLDITERKNAETALQDADRRKNEFLATLAHELRNPLAPIRNAVGILRRVEPDNPRLAAARDIIDRQVRHMVRLIDDLLDVARISHGRLQLRREPVELATVLRQAVEAAMPLVEQKRHRLDVTLPPGPVMLDADPVRLAQVFQNLLTNACKYTEAGGTIALIAERTPENATVTVRDTGIGIPAEHLPRLFEMFSQVESALERSEGGLGIGLSLARGLVEMHGGSIEARSAGPGLGSEFVVRLPCLAHVEAPIAADAAPRDAAVATTRRRVLIADDNLLIAESLSMLLEMVGFEVRCVRDGLEAVAGAEQWKPDVVLLDIGMPRLDGYAACRRIRERPWGRGMVIIAMTGWGQEDDVRQSSEAGFDLHLEKPVDPDHLLDILNDRQQSA